MKVKTGLHVPSRPCATCERDVNTHDMPFFTGTVFCSARCQVRGSRAAISAVLHPVENEAIVSNTVDDRGPGPSISVDDGY